MSQPIRWHEAKTAALISKRGKLSVVEEDAALKADKVSKIIKAAERQKRIDLNERSRMIKELMR